MSNFNEINYQDCYVAFMDILGFQDIVEKRECDQILDVFHQIKGSKIKKATMNGEELDLRFDKVHFYIMSDTIIIYINSSEKNALDMIVESTSLTLSHLTKLKNPVFVRGAVIKNKLFCQNDVMFGPAITEAYRLEKEVAIYPRVIISRKINCNESLNPIIGNLLLYVDFDRYNCIENNNVKNFKNDNERLITYIDSMLIKYDNVQRIKEKYLYLKRHYMHVNDLIEKVKPTISKDVLDEL
ncbi:MAG: hypothetical protein Q4E88_02295 [Coriobacteriia bacterium]|nr:hypothetical protein [Coriobacteriia bacterium]